MGVSFYPADRQQSFLTLRTDTVITSFPQRWNRKHSEDDLDVVESLKKHIQLREGRDPLRSAYDLAVLIASFCSEVFFEREDAPEPLDERLQFLEFFDKSIGHVVSVVYYLSSQATY